MSISVRKAITRLFSSAIIMAMLVSLGTVAFAVEDPNKGSLLGTYTVDEQPVSGVKFSIYKIADFQQGVTYTWTEEYSKYGVTIPDFTSAQDTTDFNNTIAGYIQRDNLKAVDEATTDDEGNVNFEGLDLGMYIVVGDTYSTDTAIYTPVPFLVFYPFILEGGDKSLDAEIQIKAEMTPIIPKVDRHVLKVWNDSGAENRPSSIQVQLLKDGMLYDTVTLTAGNNWRYTWSELDGTHRWTCVEASTGNGYTTSTSEQGLTYVVTNTRRVTPTTPTPTTPNNPTPSTPPTKPGLPVVDTDVPSIVIPDGVPILAEYPNIPETPTEETPTPETPTPETPTPETPTPPVETVDIPDPSVPTSDKIPQTGQLSWPIPVLALSGIACMGIGVIDTKRGKKE